MAAYIETFDASGGRTGIPLGVIRKGDSVLVLCDEPKSTRGERETNGENQPNVKYFILASVNGYIAIPNHSETPNHPIEMPDTSNKCCPGYSPYFHQVIAVWSKPFNGNTQYPPFEPNMFDDVNSITLYLEPGLPSDNSS